MRTCFGMLAGTSWQVMGKTQGQFRTISATETSNIQFGTQSFRPTGSETFFVPEIARGHEPPAMIENK